MGGRGERDRGEGRKEEQEETDERKDTMSISPLFSEVHQVLLASNRH